MNIIVSFNEVSGCIKVPASKSISQRLCAGALLHKGDTFIRHFGHSNDELAALDIIEDLGATVSRLDSATISISSTGSIQNAYQIDCGESGLSARLFTPIVALHHLPIKITGKGSLLNRPMHFIADFLPALQVALIDFEGHIPFSICGPLKAKSIKADGSLSSQFISGLLFALAYSATEKIQLEVVDLVSKPYIDLTIEVLALFGKKITHHHYQIFTIDPKLFTEVGPVNITVESDWSSAAFWIAAATIKGSVSLFGLRNDSCQADKMMLEVVRNIGADVNWENDVLKIRARLLRAFDADLADAPDLFPVLAVLGACCSGQSRLSGLHRLIHKESNRAESITQLLSQLGVPYEVDQDTLVVYGNVDLQPIQYHCPNDHRMAMAAALAAMKCEGKIEIENAECVHKSYPDFWKDLGKFTQ